MKRFLGMISLLTLMLFSASAMLTVDNRKKASPPDCSVMVCQSVDVTSNTAIFLVSDFSYLFKITTIEFIKIPGFDLVTQSIEKGYNTQIQLPPNTIISENKNNRLVSMPFVLYVDNNSKINHDTKTASATINLNNCRHV